jgi:hypothetical protein
VGKIAEAWVDVTSKTQGFDKGLDASKGKLADWVGSAQKMIAAFVIAKVGSDFLSFMGEAVKSASDLAESANKAQVAFGSAFPKIASFADEMAGKFGIVKKEVYDLTAGLGFMLTNAKLSKDVAADLAIALAKSATDVSSIQNMPVATVLEKMRAGISGEAEPLRPLGVNISEENVQKKAPELGFDPKNLNDQEKILTRISLIIGGLSYAEGDLTNTASEYANMVRKAEGDWENMKATIGGEIKPVVTELIGTAYALGEGFTEAFGATPMEAFVAYLKQAVIEVKALRDGAVGFAQYFAAGAKLMGLGGVAQKESWQSIHKRLGEQAAAARDKKPEETAKERADRTVRELGLQKQKRIDDYRKAFETPAGAKLNQLTDSAGALKRTVGDALQGPVGGLLSGFLKGGLAGAVKGAAQGGLLNQLVPQQGIGPLSTHVMAGADFARFAQEQTSSGANAQLEAQKEAAKNTKETVGQLKDVVSGIKDLATKFAGTKARLSGPS